MPYDYILLCIDRGYAGASDKGRHIPLPGDMSGPHGPRNPWGASTLGPFWGQAWKILRPMTLRSRCFKTDRFSVHIATGLQQSKPQWNTSLWNGYPANIATSNS